MLATSTVETSKPSGLIGLSYCASSALTTSLITSLCKQGGLVVLLVYTVLVASFMQSSVLVLTHCSQDRSVNAFCQTVLSYTRLMQTQ